MKASPSLRSPAAFPPIVAQAQGSPDVLTGNVRPFFLIECSRVSLRAFRVAIDVNRDFADNPSPKH